MTCVNFYLAEVFLEGEMFQANVEKIKTHILCSTFYYEYCARQATDEHRQIQRRHDAICMAGN